MTQFGANLGPIHRWVVHNIQSGPQGREGMMWGCQVDLADEQPHTGLTVHYAGDGGQINIDAFTGRHELVKQFLNDCEDCLRRAFPDKHVPEDRYAVAEGILALACDECPAGYLSIDRIQETLAYLVHDKPKPQRPATPTLDKLSSIRHFSEKIQAFLEFMHEKGYQLKKTIPAGYCAPDGSERIDDKESEARDMVRIGRSEIFRFTLNVDPDVDKTAVTREVWKKAYPLWHRGQKDEARQLLTDNLWRWDRSFELDDVGFEGLPLDKHLYEFFEIDPEEIENERQAILEALA